MIVGFFPATTMPDADWWQALWPDPVTVLVEMGVRPGMVVVDLCCGDGLFTAPLARIVDSVYAIDIDPAMLDRARALVAAAGATNCHLVVAEFGARAEPPPSERRGGHSLFLLGAKRGRPRVALSPSSAKSLQAGIGKHEAK
jgi:SAM-dependent methyltransferase